VRKGPISYSMSAENRKEVRIRSRGRMHLCVAGREDVPATLFDVSESGICVETKEGISAGTPVRIDGQGFTADGTIRYCRPLGEIYRIGVALV
jgi:PilZ domain